MRALKAMLLLLAAISAVVAEKDDLGCPDICPDNLDPACGTDGSDAYAEFVNSCEFEVFNCKREELRLPLFVETDLDWCRTKEVQELDVDLGRDLGDGDANCPVMCPMHFSPICGSNGTVRKVFSNECELNLFNCLGKAKSLSSWRILKQGTCNQKEEW